MPLFFRAAAGLFKNWRSLAAMAGLVVAVELSFERLLGEAVESAGKLWWVLVLICLVILTKEFIKHYFDLKKQQSYIGNKE